ncbi:serine/threonine-protein phosphatase 6 regulatory ankyrin repeat subunit B-like [Belonocnema kinseyi]|uniref:serine/threonine-protein phosphatase 6 regulatory ankyrin repeat subunit B-like n=1 Tax=Belonocnema kinseyi TaxID=2817044 RepID=UPI00143DD6AB|nr:serine/threonine-protein phosphatase 6 regulatory ankyrin repeat subunit B-like [Belonocnema kinseyi]XP_033229196.1 serine/threonine-protein phosphatase 6 regulatory ankyrin repeat subunit B-like [Belonocnema kinseyi]
MEESDQRQELIAAVQAGNIEEVRLLTKALGADFLRQWTPGFNLLCQSLKNKQLEIAKLLINHGCLLGERVRGDNALHVAVVYGDFEIVRMITDQGYSSRIENDQGMTALHLFPQRHPVDEECPQILRLLVQDLININKIKHFISGFSPIHFAAECGNPEMISLFGNVNCRMNPKDKERRTPLHIAASNGQARAVHSLLAHGANYMLTDCAKKTPLCVAVERQDVPTIQVLLKKSIRLENDAMLIYCAIRTMNKALIEMLLKLGASPHNRPSKTNEIPIHIAIEKGSLEIVSLLLQHGANPNVRQIRKSGFNTDKYPVGCTALHIAVEKEKLEIFQLLLQYGAKPDLIDEKGRNPLHLATKNGSVPLVTALMNCGCSVSSLFTPAEPDGYTPLHIAVELGNEDFVALFLNAGIPVNFPTKTHFVPLHLAVKKGNTGMLKLLLKYNADPRAQGPSAIETPLFFAAEVGICEIVDIISEISSNRTGEWQEGYFSLFVAAYHGHEDVVKKLLEKGVDPNANIRNYLTPLQAAAQQGHVNIVEILLKHQAEVNPKSIAGNDRFSTPLIAAFLSRNEATIEIILNQGADVNAKVVSNPVELKSEAECLLTYGYYSFSAVLSDKLKVGYTPLHFAAESGKLRFVEMIIKRGADVNAKTQNNLMPLSVAVRMQHEDLVSYLLEAGASTADAKDILLKAILLKNAKIVKLLLKYKAPLNFTFRFKAMKNVDYTSMNYSFCSNESGYTPLHLAIMKSSLEIIEELLEKGAVLDTSSGVELPFHLAVKRNDEEIILKLIEYGACIDSKCSLEITPIFHAVANLKIKAFKSLVKLGASLSVKTNKGQSLLHYAIDENGAGVYGMKDHMIKLCLKCGAKVDSENPSYISAFEKILRSRESVDFDDEYCSEDEEEEIHGMFNDYHQLLKLFLEEGFDLNTRIGGSGKTVLHFAAAVGNAETVKLLLQRNVDVNLLDGQSRTAFHYAVEKALLLLSNILEEFSSGGEEEDENLIIQGLHSDDLLNSSDKEYIDLEMIKGYQQALELARSMTKALARIQASGAELNPENVTLIKNEFVQYYYNRCNEELVKLKQRKITKRVTYYDILIANENKLSYYANNEKIIEAFKSKNLKQFPLYEEELKARFERGVARKNVCEMSTTILNYAVKVKVPCLVIYEIFKYLRYVDLKNVCRARYPLMFVSSDLPSDAESESD